jgi:hypothetical protein
MSQTQVFLVVLGLVLIGLAIYVGLSMFQADAIEHSRDAIINDLGTFAGSARSFYWKSSQLGGGNGSFNGVTIRMLYPMTENANARYYIESANDDECIIVGVGKVVSGDDSVRVRVRVTERQNIFEILN